MGEKMALAAKKLALEGRKFVQQAREAARAAKDDPNKKTELEAQARQYLDNARLLRRQAEKLIGK
jgi:hypothetical protein